VADGVHQRLAQRDPQVEGRVLVQAARGGDPEDEGLDIVDPLGEVVVGAAAGKREVRGAFEAARSIRLFDRSPHLGTRSLHRVTSSALTAFEAPVFRKWF
jgi:hypothetical protein